MFPHNFFHIELKKKFKIITRPDRKLFRVTITTKGHKLVKKDRRKIAAIDSNKHDWDWKNRTYWKKKDFCTKSFLSPIYFDGIS